MIGLAGEGENTSTCGIRNGFIRKLDFLIFFLFRIGSPKPFWGHPFLLESNKSIDPFSPKHTDAQIVSNNLRRSTDSLHRAPLQ